MFKRRTLFIVGAGASVEFDLPLGKDLASKIQKGMDIPFEDGFKPIGTGDYDLFGQLLSRHEAEAQPLQEAARLIRDGIGLAHSIDDFLDLHRTNQYVNLYGKAAIVKNILEAERASRLYFAGPAKDDYFNPDKSAETWLAKLLYMLSRGVPKESRLTLFDCVSFIVFNYDRCIEHYFLHALQRLYAISEADAEEVMKTLRIIHPYGKVGDDVPFGRGRVDYRTLADQIKTYTEQISTADLLGKLRTEFEQADAIAFLGFAYHDQNMQILQPSEGIGRKPVTGTAFKMSAPDVDITSRQIDRWFTGPHSEDLLKTTVNIEADLTCAGFFDHFAKRLVAGEL